METTQARSENLLHSLQGCYEEIRTNRGAWISERIVRSLDMTGCRQLLNRKQKLPRIP